MWSKRVKTAIIHDWLLSEGGAEKVVSSLSTLFPGDLYTLIADINWAKKRFPLARNISISFIQNLPLAKKKYRYYLPLFPLAIEQFDVRKYDLILSSSTCVAKGVLTTAEQLHICYCHSPMRYAWDLYHQNVAEGKLKRGCLGALAKKMLHSLRLWDVVSSNRVDHFIANSRYIARRIWKTYQRKAKVIYPPVDTDFYSLGGKKEEFYLTASRLVFDKKVDLIVEAFASLPDQKLLVIGEGPELNSLKKRATRNVEFLGFLPKEELLSYLQRAKGFLFASLEDFGIAPVEAMASGTPVIGYGKGGLLETVIPGETGIFFEEQSSHSLIQAIKLFEKAKDSFDPLRIRKQAEIFSKDRFEKEIKGFIEEKMKEFYAERDGRETPPFSF